MIVKNSVLIAFFSGLSVILGIFRDRLLAQYVGVGPVLDVYNASFRIPDLILGIFVAFVASSTVVPFISTSIEAEDKKELERRMNSLFFMFVLSMVCIIFVVSLALPYITNFFVPGFTETQTAHYILYTRILMLQPLLLGVSALISCLAQARHRFVLYGIAPLLYTSSIILSILFAYSTYGIEGIIGGVIFGAVLHIGLQSFTFYKEKISLHYSLFSFGLIRQHLHLAVPRSGSVVVSQLRVVFFTAFATSLGTGVLSIYLFAQKITDAITQIVAQSLSTASLPVLSAFYNANDMGSYTKSIKQHSISLFGIGVIFSAFCFFFAPQVVHLLYGNTGHNYEIARMLQVLSIGIPFFAVAGYLSYAFSTMKDTKSVLYANVVATVIAGLICFGAKVYGMGMLSIVIGVVSVNILSAFFLIFVYKAKKLHLI